MVELAADEHEDETTYEIMQQKESYPVFKWIRDLIKSRIRKGREVLMENPWPSEMWNLNLEELYTGDNVNVFTEEPLELLRLDQRMYGLVDRGTGEPHQKVTLWQRRS